MQELTDPDALEQVRIRHQGGGRKASLEVIPELEAAFLRVLENYTAGSPMNAEVKWTNLTYQEIADHLKEQDIQVSVTVVKQLLQKHHFVRRKAQKRKRAGECEQRDEQFAKIAQHREAYVGSPNPILSIDTKKELIGNLYRPGTLYTQGVVETLDHDFPSLAQGVIIPHGIYDLQKNHGYINLGTSHDTSEFACDSLRQWWHAQGQADYPHASSLLLLCDGGGSNGARTYLFKAELERFAQETGLEVRVAHYPAYTSKYNPIEHRLFPHLQRACRVLSSPVSKW